MVPPGGHVVLSATAGRITSDAEIMSAKSAAVFAGDMVSVRDDSPYSVPSVELHARTQTTKIFFGSVPVLLMLYRRSLVDGTERVYT